MRPTIYARLGTEREHGHTYGVTHFFRAPDDPTPYATDPFPSRPKPTQRRRTTTFLNCVLYDLEWLPPRSHPCA